MRCYVAKKKSTFASFSIDHPLIELVDVQVPCDDTVGEGKSKPEPVTRHGKTPRSTKKKPGRRRKS